MGKKMNPEQWTSLVRTVLAIALGPGSYVVAKHLLTPDQANQLIPVLVPAVLFIGGGIIAKWGVGAHSPQAVVAAVNSDSVPGVKAVSSSSPSQQVMVTDRGLIKPDLSPPRPTR
jgi:hypothetical protein